MDRLSELERKISDITMGDVGYDLFLLLVGYFSQQEVQEEMVRLNQSQLYEHHQLATGAQTPRYAPATIEKRRVLGIPTNSDRYHYHEFGDLFRNMGIVVAEDGVMVVCDPSRAGLGKDFMEPSAPTGDVSHIEDMFALYDPNREGLGLTEENLLTLREDAGEFVIKGLKEYLNG